MQKNKRSPQHVDHHIGTRLRMRRTIVGLSQEKLAIQLGLTFQQVQKYEKGVNRVGAGRLFLLARILGVEVSYFFDDLPEASHDSTTGGLGAGFSESEDDRALDLFLASSESQDLNLWFFQISNPRVRKRIVEMARALAENDDEM